MKEVLDLSNPTSRAEHDVVRSVGVIALDDVMSTKALISSDISYLLYVTYSTSSVLSA